MSLLADGDRRENELTQQEWDKCAATERRATELENQGLLREAIALWEQLVESVADWEHGLAWHSLANCYEDVGELARSEAAHLRAIEVEPDNSTWVGGYSSFLFLHGDPSAALEQHLRWIEVERARGAKDPHARLQPVLQALGKRVGISQSEIESRILTALQRGAERLGPTDD